MNADALSRSYHLDEPTKEKNEEYQVENEVGELKITYATDLEGDPQRLGGGLPDIRLQCTA